VEEEVSTFPCLECRVIPKTRCSLPHAELRRTGTLRLHQEALHGEGTGVSPVQPGGNARLSTSKTWIDGSNNQGIAALAPSGKLPDC